MCVLNEILWYCQRLMLSVGSVSGPNVSQPWTQVSPTLRGHHQARPHGWHLSRTPKWLPALWPGL